MLPETCIGNCRRNIDVGQTIFQVYVGGYWSSPYITPDRHKLLGNWCTDCFQLDFGGIIRIQMQPYKCSLCGRGFEEREQVIYATRGTRPAPPAQRAEIRDLHLIVCKECWTDDRFAKLYEIYDRSSSTELEQFLKRLKGANADPILSRKVRHPAFGVGVVVGVEGTDDDRRISISFPGRGTKKFIERYAHLTPA
jgi:hypothetical protein